MMIHAHTGFYIYDNATYFRREDAFDDMLAHGDLDGRVRFYYNDYLFEKIKWEHEPEITLEELYRLRAQQIRDKYKYVILSFSGGSDSTQVLYSFIKNGIHIDEIQISCAHEMTSGFTAEKMLADPDLRVFLEYDLAALPILKKVAKLIPNTKITIIDSSKFLAEQLGGGKFEAFGNDSKVRHSSPRLASTVGPLSQYWYMYKEVNADKSQDAASVCIVRGLEKPNLTVENNELYFSFNDQTMLTSASINNGEIPDCYTIEDFFWSPDAPLIPVKQAHVMKRVFETDQNFYDMFLKGKADQKNFAETVFKPLMSNSIQLERSYSRYLYPDWDTTTYAAPKPTIKTPEFVLYEKAVGSHHAKAWLDEYRDYKEKKYERLTHKYQFYRLLSGRQYKIGKMKEPTCLS